jgi:mannosyltransferase
VTIIGRRTSTAVTEEANVTSVTNQAPLDVPGRATRTRAGAHAAPRSRSLPGWALITGPLITLAMMLWGLGARPYWGDEADTVSAVSRTVPQLFRLLGHIDAVHGLYYLMLWPVARVAGTGQFATRLPSALAMAAAAAGVAAIAGRLGSRRAGLCAGLVFALLPTVTAQGHDARPYAVLTAAAVLASYLLVRAVQDPGWRWFAAYGLSLVGVGYLQLFGLLLLPAHAVTLIGVVRGRRAGGAGWPGWPGGLSAVVLRRWLVTAAAAVVVVVPVAIIGWVQRAQIAWIPTPGWSDVSALVTMVAGGSAGAAIVIGLLCALGVFGARARSRAAGVPERALVWLALPWLVLPPLILLAASVIKPVYFTRYLTYCLPAVALLAGAGIAAIGWSGSSAWSGRNGRARRAGAVGALALVAALVWPAQLGMRTQGGGMQMVAEFLAAHEHPGDAIVYPEPSIPPWYLAFPQGFSQLRDLSLAQAPGAAGRLFAPAVSRPVLLRREQSVRRIWMVPEPGRGPAGYVAPGFRLAHEWNLHGDQVVLLFTRTGPPPQPDRPGRAAGTGVPG